MYKFAAAKPKQTKVIPAIPKSKDKKRNIRKLFQSYAYPAMINMIVMALYNIVDRIFIGQGAGPMAICGLALTLPCVALMGTIGTLTGIGSAGRIAAAISSNDGRQASRILGNALLLNLLLSIILILLALLFLDNILISFGGSLSTIPYAHRYLAILIPGSLLTNLNFTCCHAIRASGFSHKSMYIISTGLIVNIILDPIFIFGFNLDIQGAAIATVLSMCVSTCMIVRHFVKNNAPFRLSRHSFSPQLSILIGIIGVGMAAFIMNITTGMVNVIMNRYLARYGGDYAIGAYGIISSYAIVISMLLMGISQGMQPIISYYYATGRQELIRYVLRTALKTGTLIAGIGFCIGELFAPWLVRAFTWDTTLAHLSETGLRITFLAMPLTGLQIILTSYFQAVRQAPKAIVMNISRQFIFLIPGLALFAHHWNLSGIWYAIPFADSMATLIALFFIFKQSKEILNR